MYTQSIIQTSSIDYTIHTSPHLTVVISSNTAIKNPHKQKT